MKKAEYIEKYGEEAWKIKRAEMTDKHREYVKKHKSTIDAVNAAYRERNREKLRQKQIVYHNANKAEINARQREFYRKNAERLTAEKRKYNKEHREEIAARFKESKRGRASNILTQYRNADKKRNRGECTLTIDWIIENIFKSKCSVCGESDWKKLGCHRVDNSLPHTPENVVCICKKCHTKITSEENSKPIVAFYENGEIYKRYKSLAEAAEEFNCSRSCIRCVCNGKSHSSHGFIWKYESEVLK